MRSIRLILFAAAAVALLLSDCSGNAGSSGAALPSTGAPSQLDSFSPAPDQGPSRIKRLTTPSNIYVADEAANQVTVYNHAGVYQRAITAGVHQPDAIAFDAAENLYVANFGNNTVTAYAKGNTLLYTIKQGIAGPTALAFQTGGILYVANSNANSVTFYQGATLRGIITSNIQDPKALAVDSTGTLYVADAGLPGWVTMCEALCIKLIKNIDNPLALALDGKNNLYVANGVASGSVTECKAGVCSTQWGVGDLNIANALAFDSFGHLCVSSYGNNEVRCFSSPTESARSLDAADGIDDPVSLVVGPSSGWLKVANDFSPKGSVTQYCPQPTCIHPNPTITPNVDGPAAIAIGP